MMIVSVPVPQYVHTASAEEVVSIQDQLVQNYVFDFEDGEDPFTRDVNCIATSAVIDGTALGRDSNVYEITRVKGEPGEDGKYGSSSEKISFEINLPETQEGKIVSFYMYDNADEKNQSVVQILNNKADPLEVGDLYFGTKYYAPTSDSIYWVRAKTSTSSANGGTDINHNITELERTTGWTKYTIDASVAGEVTFIIGEDGANSWTVDIGGNEYFSFDEIRISDYWTDGNNSTEMSRKLYFDDFTISSVSSGEVLQDVPSEPKTYDLLNQFGWKPIDGYESYTNYEYSLNGGSSFVDCTSNPQTIPNEAYAAGQVQVRRKQTAMDQPFFLALSNTEAFTTNEGDVYVDFEDMDDKGFVKAHEGSNAISTEVAFSGNQSLNLIGKSDNNFNQYLNLTERYEEKIVSLWVYDDMSKYPRLMFGPVDDQTNHGRPWESSNQKWHFFIDGNSNWVYTYRIGSAPQVQTSVKRTEGWHQFTWDFSDGENVVMSIDGTVVTTQASTGGFEDFAFIDWWNITGHTNENTDMFIDDFSITSKDENMDRPNAPTNPVIDDENDTFAFTYVMGYTNPSDYEFSVDNGKTWETCVSNTQRVPSNAYDVGTVQVRVRGIDGYLPGVALKSDVAFTSAANTEIVKLAELIDFSDALFIGDYKQDANYEAFEIVLAEARELSVEDGLDTIVSKITELELAISELTLDIDDYNLYEFEAGEADENPFIATIGNLTKGEALSVFGTELDLHYSEKHGAELETELVDGKYVSEAIYTFAQDLDDKILRLALNTEAQRYDNQEVIISDSNGNYIGFRSKSGNQTNLEVFYNDGNGEKVINTGIRRLATERFLEWDFINEDGKVVFTLDNVELCTMDMTGFNKITVKTEQGTTADSTSKFDRLEIIEANPVTSIKASAESADLGYYDTFDMAQVYLDIETKNGTYATTDNLYYMSSDADIAEVTKEGSVEPMSPGSAQVTVTASSGATCTVDINVIDYKVTDMFITDALISDIRAMDEPTQELNNSKPVEKLETFTVDVNESKALNQVLTPANATARLVEWTSSDENVVKVIDGLVTGVNYGTATVTATTMDGTNISDTVTVTVSPDKTDFDIELFVSLEGDDIMGDGSIENPYRTLERARDEIRTLNGLIPAKGAVVYFREGEYPITNTMEFNDQDSGVDGVHVVYSAYGDEQVKFVGGVAVETDKMALVDSSDPLYNRIPQEVRSSVYSIDLSQYNIELRDLQSVGHGASGYKTFPEIFPDVNLDDPYFSVSFNGTPMTLARFPNEGYIQVSTVVDTGEYVRAWYPDMILNGKGHEYEPGMEDETFKFTSSYITSSQLKSWEASIYDDGRGAWMIGYWGSAFSDLSVPIGSIDSNSITSGLPSLYNLTSRSDFYVYNLIEELDIPGEWYIDQSTDPEHPTLYFAPPTGTDMSSTSNSLVIPTLDDPMFEFYQSDYIKLVNIDVEGANAGVFNIEGGTNNVIRKTDLYNTNGKVGSIIDSENEIAKDNGFEMCSFTHIDGGISMSSGDEMNLERGYNYVENCTFTDFSRVTKTYNPAVSLNGVGNRITNSVFSDSPHNMVMFEGPETVIEFCEFFDGVKTAGDQGAIYTGRNTLNRGTVIKNSYFHDIFHSTSVENSGIYLDDAKAGVEILDCVFENTSQGITLGGGRDDILIGNTFINLSVGIVTSPAGYIGQSANFQHGLGLICNSADYDNMTEVPWSDPNSAYGRFDHLAEIFDDNMMAGKYSDIIDNTFINMDKHSDDANETIKDYNIWSKHWKVFPTYDMQIEYIQDWLFVKGNDFSNNEGTDDLSYKTLYDINLAADGNGTVTGERTDIAKGLEMKIVATENPGSSFQGWYDANDNLVSTNPVHFVTMTEDYNLTAVFYEVG